MVSPCLDKAGGRGVVISPALINPVLRGSELPRLGKAGVRGWFLNAFLFQLAPQKDFRKLHDFQNARFEYLTRLNIACVLDHNLARPL